VFSQLWSYLMRVRVLQVAALITHLGESPHSKWCVHSISIFISFLSFIFSFISITPYSFVFMFLSFFLFFYSVIFILISFIYALSFPQSIIIFTMSCVFLSAFGSEHSHLLNHLVKFVSSGDLP